MAPFKRSDRLRGDQGLGCERAEEATLAALLALFAES